LAQRTASGQARWSAAAWSKPRNVDGGPACRARRRDRALAGAQERSATRIEEGGGPWGNHAFPHAKTPSDGRPAPSSSWAEVVAVRDREEAREDDLVERCGASGGKLGGRRRRHRPRHRRARRHLPARVETKLGSLLADGPPSLADSADALAPEPGLWAGSSSASGSPRGRPSGRAICGAGRSARSQRGAPGA